MVIEMPKGSVYSVASVLTLLAARQEKHLAITNLCHRFLNRTDEGRKLRENRPIHVHLEDQCDFSCGYFSVSVISLNFQFQFFNFFRFCYHNH